MIKYCPSCGHELLGENDLQELESSENYSMEYDVYCSVCGWSGDISEDQKLGEQQ